MIDFELGQVLLTSGAVKTFEENPQTSALELLKRHMAGDWGDLCKDDAELNNEAVKVGDRIMSSYLIAPNCKIWIITEHDRSVTTLLLPSEY